MRRHVQHGWQWTRTYTPDADGGPRYTVSRRASWDLRCEEPRCRQIHGRMSTRWEPRRRRWRAGGVYR